MKSLSQLKRDIKVGTVIKTVINNIKPEKNGQVRKVAKVQTNAIVFEDLMYDSKLSWLWWGKASDYEYEENTFRVFHTDLRTNEKVLDLVYEIISY